MICKNYVICNNQTENDFCYDCEMLFGKWRNKNINLNFKIDNCTTCELKNNICVSRPTCEHFLCINCFKVLYFGSTNYINLNNDLNLGEYLEYKNFLKKCRICK